MCVYVAWKYLWNCVVNKADKRKAGKGEEGRRCEVKYAHPLICLRKHGPSKPGYKE